MNIENLRNRVDALQKTENTLLVLAMHKAGLKNVNCSDKQLNLCAVLAGNPVIFKVKEFWMEGDSGKETVFFLGCCDPIEHITLKCEDILPGMVSNILEHIPNVNVSDLSVLPQGTDDDIDEALVSSLEYLEHERDCICDTELYERCCKLEKSRQHFWD